MRRAFSGDYTPPINDVVSKNGFTSIDGLFKSFHSNQGINRAIDDTLPCPMEQHGVTIVSHSRLDNRTELCSKLSVVLKDRVQLPDHYLMLQAFLKWGSDCVNQFKGDWSFAIYDSRNQTLYLAVDYLSTYGVYYHALPDQFSFSNSLKTLVSQIPGSLKPNLRFMLERFLIHRPANAITSVEGVRFVPPGSYLSFKLGSDPKITRYWTPEHLTRHDLRRETELIQEFYSLYEQAVERRILDEHKMASHLSGGLDSGSVTWLASKCLKAHKRPLQSYTGTEFYDTSATLKGRGNEDRYAKITAAATGHIHQRTFTCANMSMLDSINEQVRNSFDVSHGVGNIFWIQEISAYARNEGINTLLVGQVGNASVTWKGVSGKRAIKVLLLDLKKNAEMMFLSHKPLDEIKRYPGTYFNSELSKWFKRDWLHQFTLDEINFREPDNIDLLRPGWVHKNRMNVLDFRRATIGLFWEQFSQDFGLYHWDPTADQELVEFCLSIPEEYYGRNGGRNLVRKAFDGQIPDEVLYKKLKGRQSSDWSIRFQMEADRWIELLNGIPAHHSFHDVVNVDVMLKNIEQLMTSKNSKYDVKISGMLARIIGYYFLEEACVGR